MTKFDRFVEMWLIVLVIGVMYMAGNAMASWNSIDHEKVVGDMLNYKGGKHATQDNAGQYKVRRGMARE